jgi:hypothetical protein
MAGDFSRRIAVARVGRIHAAELEEIHFHPRGEGQLVYQVPGGGQRVVLGPEADVWTNSPVIQVKVGGAPGRTPSPQTRRLTVAEGGQAEYTAHGFSRPSIYYVELGQRRKDWNQFSTWVEDLLEVGISEVRPIGPTLRGTEPFPLPFRGMLGVLPWFPIGPNTTSGVTAK